VGYSKNPITLERMLPWLEPLKQGPTTYRTEPGRSAWFAYRVRAALHAARANADRWPEWAALAPVRVEVLSDTEVRVTPGAAPRISWAAAEAPRDVRTGVSSGTSLDSIKERWELRSVLEDRLYFPEAYLGPKDLHALWEWAREAGVLLFENAGALTLLPLRGNEDAADYAWDPSDLDEAL
jgi:hypothetical protein